MEINSMNNQIVRNWMTINPIVTTPRTKLSEAHRLMVEHNIRYLPVVNHDRLVGILTRWDIHKTESLDGGDLRSQLLESILDRLIVREMMACAPAVISPDATIEEAAGLMVEHRIGGLPVVEDNKLVGMITETDISMSILQQEICTSPGKSTIHTNAY